MSDVDKTLQAQRAEIDRLQRELAETNGRLAEARRMLRPRNESTFMLPDGIQVRRGDYRDLDVAFAMLVPHAGRYTLHDKAPDALGVERADNFGLILKKPSYGEYGAGNSVGWLIERIECITPRVVVSVGYLDRPLQTFTGRRLVDGDLSAPIVVSWGATFQILVDVQEIDAPVDLRVVFSGLRRI